MKAPKQELGLKRLEPIIKSKHPSDKCKHPTCATCMLSKQKRTPTGATKTSLRPERGQIKADDLSPGDCFSVDNFECPILGRRNETYGKEPSNKRCCGGSIWVDHASGFIFVHLQTHNDTADALVGKQLLEQFSRDCGVEIKKFRADNNPFGSKDFKADCALKGQHLDFSAPYAHHMNGVSERAVHTVMSWARYIMLHSMVMWPDQADVKLWPQAVQHACHIYNRMPSPHHGFAPLELFSKSHLPNYATYCEGSPCLGTSRLCFGPHTG